MARIKGLSLSQAQDGLQLMRRAGDEFFSPATLGLVGGIIGEYALERGLFTVGRGVFGDSSQGLDARQVLARQLARLAIGITGAAIAVSAKEEAEKAVGVGMMGESIISLLKGAGVSFGG